MSRKKFVKGLKLARRLFDDYDMPIPHSVMVESVGPIVTLQYFLILEPSPEDTIRDTVAVVGGDEWSVMSTTVSVTKMIDDITVEVRMFVPAKDRWTSGLREALMEVGWHGANESKV